MSDNMYPVFTKNRSLLSIPDHLWKLGCPKWGIQEQSLKVIKDSKNYTGMQRLANNNRGNLYIVTANSLFNSNGQT